MEVLLFIIKLFVLLLGKELNYLSFIPKNKDWRKIDKTDDTVELQKSTNKLIWNINDIYSQNDAFLANSNSAEKFSMLNTE